jgi:prepilin-type N-terminal cleavage/methylation domain-containing protein
MKKHSGFTLIELMVVMAIIAILATAGLTAYSSYLKKARDSARTQIARELMTKVEELANGGRNPTGGELITFLNTENFASTVQSSILSSLYLPDIDPLSGKKQCYDF